MTATDHRIDVASILIADLKGTLDDHAAYDTFPAVDGAARLAEGGLLAAAALALREGAHETASAEAAPIMRRVAADLEDLA